MLSDSALMDLWNRLRLEFELLAEGATTGYDKTSHGKPESKPPPRAGEDLRALDRRWSTAVSRGDKRAVLRDALTILRAHLVSKPLVTRRGTKEWRMAIASDPDSSRVVAGKYDVNHKTVLRYRREFGVVNGAGAGV